MAYHSVVYYYRGNGSRGLGGGGKERERVVRSCDVIQSKFEGVDIQLTGF